MEILKGKITYHEHPDAKNNWVYVSVNGFIVANVRGLDVAKTLFDKYDNGVKDNHPVLPELTQDIVCDGKLNYHYCDSEKVNLKKLISLGYENKITTPDTKFYAIRDNQILSCHNSFETINKLYRKMWLVKDRFVKYNPHFRSEPNTIARATDVLEWLASTGFTIDELMAIKEKGLGL